MSADPLRPSSKRSLEKALRSRLFLVLLIIMLGLLWCVHLGISRLTQEFVLSHLQHDAESLIAALEVTPEGQAVLSDNRLPLVYQRPQSGHYYQLMSEGQLLRSRSLWDIKPSMTRQSPGKSAVATESPVAGQSWLIWQQGFSKQGQNFTLWVAEDVAPLRSEQRQFEFYLLTMILIALPILLLLQGRVLRNGFARLRPVRDAIAQQQVGGEVFFPKDVPEEVYSLVLAIEDLLKRSDERIHRSRIAVGNLAHELKRPLQQLQVLARRQSDTDTRDQLLAVFQQLHQRIESELRRARIAGSPRPGHLFQPKEEIPNIVILLNSIHHKAPEFRSNLPDGSLPYDRDDMLELLGNLLDNAWGHADNLVTLDITFSQPSPEKQYWKIRVEDDGEGVSEDDLVLLSERGIRLDEARQQGSATGHGLGLSICTDVAGSYGGHVEFSHSDRGGLKVEVTLPG